jgi:rhodanese-related sulfurtransferase
MQLNNVSSITLIDVRNKTELEDDGKIPGSFSVPLSELREAFHLSSDEFCEKYGFDLPSKRGNNLVLSCRYISTLKALLLDTQSLDLGEEL